MTTPEEDPGASTQQFRAYVAEGRAEPKPEVHRGRVAVAVLVAIAVVVVAIVLFALTR